MKKREMNENARQSFPVDDTWNNNKMLTLSMETIWKKYLF